MVVYADYDFYSRDYMGKLDEESFDRFIPQATQYLRYLTGGKTDCNTGEEVKRAACEVVDIYHETSKSAENGRVQSENNDGYSVSYVVDGESDDVLEATRDRKAYQAARKWLLGTGLLNRKADIAHVHERGYYNL